MHILTHKSKKKNVKIMHYVVMLDIYIQENKFYTSKCSFSLPVFGVHLD